MRPRLTLSKFFLDQYFEYTGNMEIQDAAKALTCLGNEVRLRIFRHLIAQGTDGDTPGTPCGGCRQRIREFANAETRVHATTVDGAILSRTLDELLPSSFGPERLVVDSPEDRGPDSE